jgi:hypothetical protein
VDTGGVKRGDFSDCLQDVAAMMCGKREVVGGSADALRWWCAAALLQRGLRYLTAVY